MANSNKKKKDNSANTRRWPSKKSLEDSLEVFDKFRALCELQLEQGYWATISFPSKHHLNKILSVQYMDGEILEECYGFGLSNKALETARYCKSYLVFVKGGSANDTSKDKKGN